MVLLSREWRFLLLILVFLVCSIPSVLSTSDVYYGDIEIVVGRDGFTSISGLTNYDSLITDNSPQFTSKDGLYWILNVSVNETFSNFVYKVVLPPGSSINYFKAYGFSRFESSGNSPVLIGFFENNTLDLVVQYTTSPVLKSYFWFFVSLAAILIVLLFFIFRHYFRKRSFTSAGVRVVKKSTSRFKIVLFLDLVNYTKLTSTLDRDGLNKLPDEFDLLVKDPVENYDGNIIKKIGDAFLIVFDSSIDALHCAINLQQTFASHNPKFGGDSLKIRIAIHAGEVVLRDDDIFGDVVNIASRVEGVCKEDDILITKTLYDISSKKEFSFTYFGKETFKGVDLPIDLYSVDVNKSIKD